MRRILTGFLALILFIGIGLPSFANENFQPSEDIKSNARIRLEEQSQGLFEEKDMVNLMVEVDTDYFSDFGRSLTGEELRDRSNFPRQIEFANKVNDKALEIIKEEAIDFELLYKLDLIMVGFTGRATYGEALRLADLDCIRAVEIAIEHKAPEFQSSTFDMMPMMVNSRSTVGAKDIYSEFKGEGTIVAVIDSGFDLDHPVFYLNDLGREKAKIKSAEQIREIRAKDGLAPGSWISDKVPFAYNYADNNMVIKEKSIDSHGQHVAGTSVGNRVEISDGLGIREFYGIAPEAQLLAMRAFSEGKGTGPNIYVPAINDAVKLGADSVNMSLGSPAGQLSSLGKITTEAIDKAAEIGCLVAIASGNESQFGQGHSLPRADYPDYGIVGSPAVARDGLAVASMENTKKMSSVIKVYDQDKLVKELEYSKQNTRYEFDGNTSYSLVHIGLADKLEEIQDLTGKLALIERGGIPFSEKIENAAKKGAIGAIVYNSESGGNTTFGMAGIEEAKIPSVAIGRSSGLYLRENIDKSVVVSKSESFIDSPISGQVSDFSNWGVTADGDLKPDIMAPGGNIYSAFNDGQFGNMSGTSMATPHVAGGISLVRSRVDQEFAKLSGREKFVLVRNLLMSTAKPHINEETNAITSPRKQGSGIMDLNNAVHSNVIVRDKLSKESKINLRDIENNFTLNMELKNLADKDLEFTYKTIINTDQIEDGYFTLNPRCLKEVPGSTINLEGKSTYNLSIDLDISEFDRELQGLMENGYWVEGFVIFTSQDHEEISIPFVGFRGNFAKLATIEPSIYDLVEEGKLPFYYSEDYSNMDFTHLATKIDGKDAILGQVRDFDKANPKFTELVISNNGDGKADYFQVKTTFLRNVNIMKAYLVKLEDGRPTGEQIELFDTRYPVKKHHHSSRWAKSLTQSTWRLPNYKTNNLEEGEYLLDLRSISPVLGPDGKMTRVDNSIRFKVDNTKPRVEEIKFEEETRSLSFKAIDDISDILYEEVYYEKDGEKNYLEKTPAGYIVPESISIEDIYVKIVDLGYNELEARAIYLIEGVEFGSITLNPQVVNQGEVPSFDYKAYTNDEEEKEINISTVRTGSYKIEVTNWPEDYKLLTEMPIIVEVTKENLNPKIDIKFEKLQTYSLTVINDSEEYENLDIYAIGEDGREYKLENIPEHSLFAHWYSKSLFDGEYKLEVRDLGENLLARFTQGGKRINKVTINGAMPDLVNMEIVDLDGAKVSVTTSPSNLNPKYFIMDDLGNILSLEEPLKPGKYIIYPEKVEGYYPEKQEIEFKVEGKEDIQINFNFKEITGTGSLRVEDNASQFGFKPQYMVIDYYQYLEGDRTQKYDLNNLDEGHYYLLPIAGSFDYNYQALNELRPVFIEKDKTREEIYTWRSIALELDGTLFINVDTEEEVDIGFEVTMSNGEKINHIYNKRNFMTSYVDINHIGKTTVKAVNVPAGYYMEPEEITTRALAGYTGLYFKLIKGNKPVENRGSLEVIFTDDNNLPVANVDYKVLDSDNKEVKDLNSLAYGDYQVEILSYNEELYSLLGEKIKSVRIDKETNQVEFKFQSKSLPEGYGEIQVEFRSYQLDGIPEDLSAWTFDAKGNRIDGIKTSTGNYKILVPVEESLGRDFTVWFDSEKAGTTVSPNYTTTRLRAGGQTKLTSYLFRAVSQEIKSVFSDGADIQVEYKAEGTRNTTRSGELYTDMTKLVDGKAFIISPVQVPEGYTVDKERIATTRDFLTGQLKPISFTYTKEAVQPEPEPEKGSLELSFIDQDKNPVEGVSYQLRKGLDTIIAKDQYGNLEDGEYVFSILDYDKKNYDLKTFQIQRFEINETNRNVKLVFEFTKKEQLDPDPQEPQANEYKVIFKKSFRIAELPSDYKVKALDKDGKVYQAKKGELTSKGQEYILDLEAGDYIFNMEVLDENYQLESIRAKRTVYEKATSYLKNELEVTVNKAVGVNVVSKFINGPEVPVDYIVVNKYKFNGDISEYKDLYRLPLGYLIIKPMEIPEGYKVEPEELELEQDYLTGSFKDVTFTYTGEAGEPEPELKGSLQVVFKDQNGLIIDGVIYKVLDENNQEISEKDYNNLALGKYKVKVESYDRDKYVLEEDEKTFTISEDNLEASVEFVFSIKLDKTELEKAKEEAKLYYPADYTEESYKKLEKALNLPEETQEEIDAKIKAIRDAIEGLKEKINLEPLIPAIDKRDLKKAIDQAEAKEADKYTEESFSKLEEALKEAKEVYQDKEATQEAIDQAKDDLIKAIEGLKEVVEEKPDIKPTPSPIKPLPELKPRPKDNDYDHEWTRVIDSKTPIKKLIKEEVKEEVVVEERKPDIIIKATKADKPVAVTDIMASKYEKEIIEILARGLMAGVGENKFDPETGITRAMVVQVLMNMTENVNTDVTTSKFTDVKTDDWFFKAVHWAEELGLVVGVGEGKFEPNRTINLQELSIVIKNYLEKAELDLPIVNELGLKDTSKIADWALESVEYIHTIGLFQLEEPVDGKQVLTRADLARALYVIANGSL